MDLKKSVGSWSRKKIETTLQIRMLGLYIKGNKHPYNVNSSDQL